jgi:hypothetical protein
LNLDYIFEKLDRIQSSKKINNGLLTIKEKFATRLPFETDKKYNDDMIHFNNAFLSVLVTKDHDMIYQNKSNHEFRKKKAIDFSNNVQKDLRKIVIQSKNNIQSIHIEQININNETFVNLCSIENDKNKETYHLNISTKNKELQTNLQKKLNIQNTLDLKKLKSQTIYGALYVKFFTFEKKLDIAQKPNKYSINFDENDKIYKIKNEKLNIVLIEKQALNDLCGYEIIQTKGFVFIHDPSLKIDLKRLKSKLK